MRIENEEISLSRKDVDAILREIEFILVSLGRLNRHYESESVADLAECEDYYAAITKFFDCERVTDRLAKMRMIISSRFDDTLGDDDMDDLERVLDKIELWERPGDA
ncbi:hypothetical protein [Pseudomonas sichuanensis]|uniref:hypothetical protein n=1 Tax=Pseudomonas sichuanensis TaxID=2213015 RepID=UPI000DA6C509|nr:hypothetical protein [Pseudomonas sichuanensis]